MFEADSVHGDMLPRIDQLTDLRRNRLRELSFSELWPIMRSGHSLDISAVMPSCRQWVLFGPTKAR